MNKSTIAKYKILPSSINKNRINRAFRNVPHKTLKQLIHFSKPEKYVIALTIVAILLVSAFGFLIEANKNLPTVEAVSNDPTASPSPTQTTSPTSSLTSTPNPTATRKPPTLTNPNNIIPVLPAVPQKQPGPIESSLQMNETVWRAVAANAWKYFQPGTGIDSTTGLPAASYGYNRFTDWDLGVYIQTVIAAEKIGLVSKTGQWGSNDRLDKVIRFLETRELNSTTNIPFWFYGSDGSPYLSKSEIDVVDAGTLFVALNNLKSYNSSFASRIDALVYNKNNNRTDYTTVIPNIIDGEMYSASIYGYYYVSGYASFFPELAGLPNIILNNILTAETTLDPYNSSLPKAYLSCEPLLYSVFNLKNNPNIMILMNKTYSAHEAKYNATGEYVAFGEGNSPAGYVWEWVSRPNGDTWKVSDGQGYLDMKPVVFYQVSMSFLAIYNSTFARNMCIYLENVCPEPVKGYYTGADYNNIVENTLIVDNVNCNVNGLIISAASYALNSNG